MFARRSRKPTTCKRNDDDDGGDGGCGEESRTAGHAYRGNYEDGGSTGESADAAAIVDDEARAEESDALHDIRSDRPLFRVGVASQDSGKQGKECAAQCRRAGWCGRLRLGVWYSRSRPMRPPSRDAASRRGTAPLTTTTCCSQLKSKGCAKNEASVVLIGCHLDDAITALCSSAAGGVSET